MQLKCNQPHIDLEQSTTDILSRAREPETELHIAVFGIVAGCYLSMLGVFWWVFSGSSQTIFMIVICAVYFAMYFGTPYVMSRLPKHRQQHDKRKVSWSTFLQKPFATNTGLITGREATIQICLIPTCLLFATLVIGIIIRTG